MFIILSSNIVKGHATGDGNVEKMKTLQNCAQIDNSVNI